MKCSLRTASGSGKGDSHDTRIKATTLVSGPSEKTTTLPPTLEASVQVKWQRRRRATRRRRKKSPDNNVTQAGSSEANRWDRALLPSTGGGGEKGRSLSSELCWRFCDPLPPLFLEPTLTAQVHVAFFLGFYRENLQDIIRAEPVLMRRVRCCSSSPSASSPSGSTWKVCRLLPVDASDVNHKTAPTPYRPPAVTGISGISRSLNVDATVL